MGLGGSVIHVGLWWYMEQADTRVAAVGILVVVLVIQMGSPMLVVLVDIVEQVDTVAAGIHVDSSHTSMAVVHMDT